MTVQTNTNVASFNGDGANKVFPIGYKFNSAADLVVLLVDDVAVTTRILTLNSDFTVTGAGDDEGGTVTLEVAPTANQRLTIIRIVDILQLTDLRNQGKFYAEIHEDAFDLLTMIAQQHQSDIASSLRVAETDPEPARIPSVAQRAGKLLAFDSAGNPTTVLPVADSSTELRQELAADQGAELVGFSLSGVSGAILRTINDRSSESVSVKDFGAVGDGIANDTAAINAALDSVPLLKTGRIFVPAGTYRVRRTTAVGDYNTALLIKHSNTQLILDPRAVIMLDDGQDCAVIRTAMDGIDAGFSGRLSNISILGGGVIDGNWDNQTWAGPDGSAGGTVTVYDQDGIMMNAVDGVQLDVHVRNCGQDGITIGSSTKIDVWGGSVKDCGKGGLTFFLCESFTVHGGDFENPNSSPDDGATKPFYTISSEGYAALGAAYKPDASFSTERNKGAFVSPRIKCRKGAGRGISIINTFGLDIVAPDIEMWGNRQAITVGCQNAGVPSNTDAIAIIGGQIHRLSQTADARVVSLTSDKANTLYVRNVSVSGLKVRSFGAYTSSVVATDVTGSLSLTDLRVEHGGAATSGTLDIRGCDDVSVVGGSLTGTITFGNGGTTALARVVGTKLGSAMIGISAVTKLLGSSNSGDSSTSPVGDVLRAGASIGAATTEETAITINGAVVGDAVLVSHTNPANIATMDVRADVTAANTVTLRLRNNTAAAVTVGSGTFYFRVVKR